MHSARPRAALLIALALPLSAAPGPGCRAADAPAPTSDAAPRDAERRAMVRDQIEARGVRDRRVLDAMRAVPRHRFVPESHRDLAYADMPLPIGRGQTISQPYIVAFMAEALRLRGGERILEIGSGSGYALAVLSRLGAEVHGIELEPELHDRSAATLRAIGYPNVQTRAGDGFRGWPEKAPFDAILVSCAVEELPAPLWDQLAQGGRVVFPAGPDGALQHLVVRTKTSGGPREERLLPVRFVPMRRAAQPRRRRKATAETRRPPARCGRRGPAATGAAAAAGMTACRLRAHHAVPMKPCAARTVLSALFLSRVAAFVQSVAVFVAFVAVLVAVPAAAQPAAAGDRAAVTRRLVAAALERAKVKVRYVGDYVAIRYPGGDVPAGTGVCTDEIIRVYRSVGIDLQREVHEDMVRARAAYGRPGARLDTNIDHRRVVNLMVFFGRHGEVLPITARPDDYRPGDLVVWDLVAGHIGVVVDRRDPSGSRPLVLHNVGRGPMIEDALFSWRIIGHYRYLGMGR